MTDLAGIQQSVQKVAEKTIDEQAQSGAADKGAASASDVERFNAALEHGQPTAQSGEPPAVDAVEETVPIEAAAKAEPSSPGDRVLDSLQNIRTGYQTALKELEQALRAGNTSPAEMLAIQTKVQAVTLQQDMMGKIVGKSEQNIDTLLKGQ